MRRLLAAVLCLALPLPASAAHWATSRAATSVSLPPVLPATFAAPPMHAASSSLPAASPSAAPAAQSLSLGPQAAAFPAVAAQQQQLIDAAAKAPPAEASGQARVLFEGPAAKPGQAASGDPGPTAAPASGPGAASGLSAPSASSPRVRGEPPAPKPPRRARTLRKKIIIGVTSVLLGAGLAYTLIVPRIDPVRPPPTLVGERGPFDFRPDAAAKLFRAPDASQPLLELSLKAMGNGAASSSIDPTGKAAVTIAPDGTWRLWDLQSGQAASPHHYPGHALASAWADEGRTLILLDDDGTVRLIERKTGKVRSLAERVGGVALHSFSPDGKRLAFSTPAGLVVILDLATAKSEAFQAQGEVLSMASTPEGTLLATRLASKVKLWSIVPGRPPTPLADRSMLGAKMGAADISADGSRLLGAGTFGAAQGLIAVRTANGKAQILSGDTIELGEARIVSVALDADGSRAAVLASDGRLWLWYIEGNDTRLLGRSPGAGRIAFNQDGARLLLSGSSGLQVWSTAE